MYTVDLPRVEGDTTLEGALTVMRSRKCSGVITEQRGEPVVISLRQLLVAVRKDGWSATLDRIQPDGPTLEVSESLTERLDEPASRDALDSMFALRGASQAVAPLSGSTGRVVTQSIGMAEHLRLAVVVCTCKSDGTHVWMHDDLTGGKCRFDGSDVDCE